MLKSKILFQMSGSIAAFKACSVLSELVKHGHEVKVVASPSLFRFVGRATLEGLTHQKVFCDPFEENEAMSHIDLERWADLIVLCPASAHKLNELAQGTGSDLISTLFLAHEFTKPYLIFPAMNQAMWRHPTTQISVQKLKSFGVQMAEPDQGLLACGEVGEGRLLEPAQILAHIESALQPKTLHPKFKNLNVLVTLGGTKERLDNVRSLTNLSTGTTGALIADEFFKSGLYVKALCGYQAVRPLHVSSSEEFSDFSSLEQKMVSSLKERTYQVIIHSAAVSDYSVESVSGSGQFLEDDKISSAHPSLDIRLKPNPKLIDLVQPYTQGDCAFVAFKLLSHASVEDKHKAIHKLFSRSHVDFVVFNDTKDMAHDQHLFEIYKKNAPEKILAKAKSKRELAPLLVKLVLQHLVSLRHEEEWI